MGNAALVLIACFTAAAGEADLLIADFEQESYGDWKAEGERSARDQQAVHCRGRWT